jgi:hypothetical protein
MPSQIPAEINAPSSTLFVSGTTRSGTTLLRLMLDHHPDVCVPYELEWALDFPKALGYPPTLESYWQFLAGERALAHAGLTVNKHLTFPDLVRSFLDQLVAAKGREKRWGGAQIHRHYRRFLELYPEARFVHIVRDGRDVCASWLRLGWVGSALRAGHEWSRAIEDWQELMAVLPAGRAVELRFEDLVAEPREQLTRVCNLLRIPFDARMLEYSRRTTYAPPCSSEAFKWRQTLSPRQVELFEAAARPWLQHYGYPESGQPVRRVSSLDTHVQRVEDRLQRARVNLNDYGFMLWLGELVTRHIPIENLRKHVVRRRHALENQRLQ